jgi:hypothetical protein
MKKELLIGKIGNDKVILEVELKNKKASSSSAITTALTPAGSNYITLSICGSIGNHSSGQIHDSINPSDFDELYIDQEQLIHLLAIWKTCHLNDMNAGSLLQMKYVNFWRDQIKSFNGWDYDQAMAMLKQHHLLIDNETNPELTVGYRYGTLWLIDLLPQSVIDFIQNLQLTPPDKIRSAIMDYLIDNEYHWKIGLTSNNPNMQIDQPMDHWKVELINQYDDCFKTYFSTGIGHRLMLKDPDADNQFKVNRLLTNWKNKTIKMMGFQPKKMSGGQSTDDYKTVQELGFYPPPIGPINRGTNKPFKGVRVPPMPDQVIECICSDCQLTEGYHSWEDWATDLGFDLNSKTDRSKARRSFETIIDQSEQAQEFFGSDWNELIERTY